MENLLLPIFTGEWETGELLGKKGFEAVLEDSPVIKSLETSGAIKQHIFHHYNHRLEHSVSCVFLRDGKVCIDDSSNPQVKFVNIEQALLEVAKKCDFRNFENTFNDDSIVYEKLFLSLLAFRDKKYIKRKRY